MVTKIHYHFTLSAPCVRRFMVVESVIK